jgi:hypothetical protein
MSTEKVECPFCGYQFKESKEWIIKNGRVFCGCCCKAFDVELEEPEKNYYGEYYD